MYVSGRVLRSLRIPRRVEGLRSRNQGLRGSRRSGEGDSRLAGLTVRDVSTVVGEDVVRREVERDGLGRLVRLVEGTSKSTATGPPEMSYASGLLMKPVGAAAERSLRSPGCLRPPRTEYTRAPPSATIPARPARPPARFSVNLLPLMTWTSPFPCFLSNPHASSLFTVPQ